MSGRTNIAPNSAPPTRNTVAAAALKRGERKSVRSMSARGARSPWTTNSATSSTPARIGAKAIGCPMPPWLSVSDNPKTMPASPGESSARPTQSSRPALARPVSRGRRRAARGRAASEIGTLTRKIQRQDALSTISPPMTGPRIGPSSIGTPITDITRPTRRGPAVCASRLIPTGMIIPPPRPCSTLNRISEPADHDTAHSAEPRPKSPTEAIHTGLDPKRSDIQPESGITIASASR